MLIHMSSEYQGVALGSEVQANVDTLSVIKRMSFHFCLVFSCQSLILI